MRSVAHYFPTTARILMGLIFFVTGLNGFMNFIPPPKSPMSQGAAAFIAALMHTGYMLRLVMGTQLVVGILLLTNRFIPLALALVAPIIIGIVTFHIFLERSGLPLAVVVVVLEIYLAWSYRKSFLPMLAMKTPADVK